MLNPSRDSLKGFSSGPIVDSENPILAIQNLTKHFRVSGGKLLRAVDGINLEIRKKETVGLVGESGCGKSTLGRTIMGLYDKTAGEVSYQGNKTPTKYKTADFERFAREIQMIFQDPYSSLNPRMTLREILAEGPLIHRLWRRDEVESKVAFWLSRVGLAREYMSRYPHEFSGGQRQRIGIARALVLEPKVIVCDEPISALDVSVQAQIINLLDDLKQAMGLTLLFIAHDLSMVRYVSDRMAVMYLGKLAELGPSNEVFQNPKHPYTQILIAANPIADPVKGKSMAAVAPRGEIPSPVDTPIGCRFAGRCPKTQSICHTREPKWLEVSPGHFVACHLYDKTMNF